MKGHARTLKKMKIPERVYMHPNIQQKVKNKIKETLDNADNIMYLIYTMDITIISRVYDNILEKKGTSKKT